MLLSLITLVPLFLLIAFLSVYFLHLSPPRHPTKIPTIPFWVTLLPLFRDVDQEETYKTYLEKPLRKYGAVKIYFGSRWNILVSKPEFMALIFRNEDLFRKSGNQEKVPYGVFASWLGDNIISAHGERWRRYRDVIQPGLQKKFDRDGLKRNTKRLKQLIIAAQGLACGRAIPVQDLLQRYTIDVSSQALFCMDLKAMDGDGYGINALQTSLKRALFKPAFLIFPFLDYFPFSSRRYARALVASSSAALQDHIKARNTMESSNTAGSDGLSGRLLSAVSSGKLTEQQFGHNLNVLFLASQENLQTALISVLYLLTKHPEVQQRLVEELATSDGASLESLPYLTSTILESLRLYPPINQLINRLTTAPALLSSATGSPPINVPPGIYVGYHAYSANRSPEIWGDDADEFRPERWGGSLKEIRGLHRRARAKAGFVTFHGGRRACLGEGFAMSVLRVTVAALVSSFEMRLGPGRVRMMPAGPLYPRRLELSFTERNGCSGTKQIV